jgi:hypothetical protein
MNYKEGKIALTNLALNIENPRFEAVGSQREAIQTMISEQEDKLINLAKHIVEVRMLNPGESIYVTPDKKEKNKFIVLEGNRRVTALKILDNIGLVGVEQTKFLKRIKPYVEKFKLHPITEIQCIVFDNVNDANKWIELKHTGENDGVGVVKWGAREVARFEERIKGVSPLALQVIEFLNNEKTVSNDVKEKLKKVPTSSLKRLLTDKNIQKAMGFSINDNRIVSNIIKSELAKGLSKMAIDLADKKIKVKDIYSDTDRENYLLEHITKEHLPDKSKVTSSIWEILSPNEQSSKEKEKGGKAKKKDEPLSTDRETLIPKDFVIKITDPKSNKIYKELRYINVNYCENATAVLFRVFIELSIDAFIAEKKIQGLKKMSPLKDKVESVFKFMEHSIGVNDHILTRLRTDVGNKNSVLSIDTFNSYVHNRHFTPIPKDLKTQWDDVQIFIETIWENIK